MNRAEGGAPTCPGPGAVDELVGQIPVVFPGTGAVSRLERGSAASEAQWRAVFDKAPVAVFEMDLDGSIVRANPVMARLLDCPVGQLEGTSLISHVQPDEREPSEHWVAMATSGGPLDEDVTLHLVSATGTDRWALVSAARVGDDADRERVLVYAIDVSAEHLGHQGHGITTDRLAALVEHSADAIVVQDVPGGNVVYASPGLFAITGTTPAAAIGSSLTDLVHPDDLPLVNALVTSGLGTAVSLDCRLRHIDAGWRHVEVTSTNLIDDPAVGGIVVNLRDVTERVEAANLLAHQAMHDPLTDLPNRALLLDRLDHALARAARSGRPCALLFIDLDRFKRVNDTLGHGAGDQLLKVVATRLRQAIRPGDSASRLGGDEFVVLAEEIEGQTAAEIIAERARDGLAQPVHLGRESVTVSCSIGIALSAGHSPEALLHEADIALSRAKHSGRNRWAIYDQALPAGCISPRTQ